MKLLVIIGLLFAVDGTESKKLCYRKFLKTFVFSVPLDTRRLPLEFNAQQ